MTIKFGIMNSIDFEKISNCAKLLFKDIVENKSTKSQLKAKFSSKCPENSIEIALKFLEDEEYIGSKKVGNLDYYSRITGYYQKVSGWNAGKLMEWKNRHRYSNM